MKETDLDAKEMEELNMEKRLRLATKKMEEMVKEQLRNSGVVPSGLKNNLIKINIKVENFLPAKLAGLAGENPEILENPLPRARGGLPAKITPHTTLSAT